jgi:lysozyme family protein
VLPRRRSEAPDYQRPQLCHHWWCLWIQTLERLLNGVPDRVNQVSDASDDALALRSLIGTSHCTICALGLPVLPLFKGFGNGIKGRHVSTPRLPK